DEFFEKSKTKKEDWICESGPRLDHADYLIEDIEIRPIKKRGKGWVAKRDIPEYTLLMVSKAFKVVFSNELPMRSSVLRRSPNIVNQAAQLKLVANIAEKLTVEPNLCREVYQLYAGPDVVPVEKLDAEYLLSVDMKRIEGIVKYN